MNFIPEVKRFWKMYSVQVLGLLGAINAAWFALPPNWHFGLNAEHVIVINSVLAAVAAFVRQLKQESVSGVV